MSVCAVLLVKDEADIIEATVRHLLAHVDEVFVMDNGSTDGTVQILEALPCSLGHDTQPGYWQSQKTTAMALDALSRGHRWVLPCDADEIWYATDGRRIADYLAGLAPDVQICQANLYDHVPTLLDSQEIENPVARLNWRLREHAPLGKVACRLSEELVIDAGNHSARLPGPVLKVGGLAIRHFSWRTAEQYVRKIRNGSAAYAATDLPADIGTHWRMWDGYGDDEIVAYFEHRFLIADPHADDTLVYDPAPLQGGNP